MLTIIGLSRAQLDVYRLLCEQGTMRIADIERALGRTAAADLETLRDKGYVIGSDPCTPIPPDLAVIGDWVQERQRLWDAEQAVRDLMETWIAGAGRRTWDQRVVEFVEGHDDVAAHFAALQMAAEHEILVMVTYPPATMTPPSGDLAQQRATLRGVTYRVLLESAYLTEADDAARREIVESASHDEEIRCADELPYKLLVVDRQIAMLSPHARDCPSEAAVTGICIRQASLVRALVEHFEAVWDRAAGLHINDRELSLRRRGDGLDPIDKAILEHLVAGQDDLVIARIIGKHVRTVKRRISDMMIQFDAKNRTQLGYVAAKFDLLAD